MFGLKRKTANHATIACCLSELGYSLSAIRDNKTLAFSEQREFTEKQRSNIPKAFVDDANRLDLTGKHCRVILAPGLYQLLLMDALDVPEEEMAKALKWRLKGLVNHPLNDLAIDVFSVPPHGVVSTRKKVFLAATPLLALKTKLAMFEAAFMSVDTVDIAELAMRNIIALMPHDAANPNPLIVIGLETGRCQLQVFYNNNLYLVRELTQTLKQVNENGPEAQALLLEIQRSIDFCLSELKLPEPKTIAFTPSFYQANELMHFLKTELNKNLMQIDLADFLQMDPHLSLEQQKGSFYSIGGALLPPQTENT